MQLQGNKKRMLHIGKMFMFRSNGLKCVSTCGYCRGDGCDNSSLCSNGEESYDVHDVDDVHDNIFEIMLGY